MRVTLSLFVCLFVPFIMMGQAPVAAFTQNVTTGCSPLAVGFTDQSTGTGLSYHWDFGPLLGLRTDQNPYINFPPGTYSVTLTVINASGVSSVTKTDLIVSNPSPTASFTADRNIACLPVTIQFTDHSVANAGSINSWLWTFSDGTTSTTSTAQNPQNPYTLPGYYDVTLKVTSTTGCSSIAAAGRFIRIVSGVKADFDKIGPATCLPPFAITYKDLTSGPGNLTYNWDLGNGNTSTQSSPSTIYNASNSYTVKLSVQSDFGCGDAITKTVPVNGNTTSFTPSTDSICLGSPVLFTNTSSPLPQRTLWNFGDGSTSNAISPPQKTYAATGIYAVKLVGTYTGCTDSVSKTVQVFDKPTVGFTAANSNNCKAPFTVTFQNTSPDVKGASWDFGDGNSSNSIAASVPHTYTSTGTFTVKLTITDSKGCSNTIDTFKVNILPPVAKIGGIPLTGGFCTGQAFSLFSASSSSDGIVSYFWDFGDGTTSTGSVASHSYSTAGIKTITHSITTTGGCTVSTSSTIQIGPPPTIDFTVDKIIGCASDSVKFTNLTTPAGYTNVMWDFGDGSTLISSTNSHKFLDTGFHKIKLTVTSNGCTDSLTKANVVYTKPPAANFGYKILDCNNKNSVTFLDSSKTDPSKPPLTYLWSFGDATNTTSPAIPPAIIAFTYPAVSGFYKVKLKVVNDVCTDSVQKTIQVVYENAKFTTNKNAFCRKEKVILTSANTAAFIKRYQWIIDAGAPVDSTAVLDTNFATTGNHTVQLITTDINGCVSPSAIQTIAVTGPTASFSVTNGGGCKNKAVSFTDASTPAGTITKWTFDFGDGSPLKSFTAPPFIHSYSDTGLFSVKLTVNDIGCSDTFRLSNAVAVTRPAAFFSASSQVYCPGLPLQFRDSSQGQGLSYLWNFGDGSFDNSQNPAHPFNISANPYTVSLIVTDFIGCADTLIKSSYITIKSPLSSFTAKDTITYCPPLETKFSSTSKDNASLSWDFGDGFSFSTLPSPNHFYNDFGNYTAKLYAYGIGGCVDSSSINIRVTDPTIGTKLTFNPKDACNELNVSFDITAPLGARYQLIFGDGASYLDSALTNATLQASTQHLYTLPNIYSPYLILSDNTGCQAQIGSFGAVTVRGAVPIFGVDKKKFCDSSIVLFSDYSQDGRDPIIKRSWDFGDGQSIVTTGDIVHDYNKPGLYIPTLTVTSTSGCDKAYTDTIRVLATPSPVINSADGICTDLMVDFKGSLLVPPDTSITWKWDLSGGITSNNQNVSVNYPDTGIHHISLEAVNVLGCKGDTTKDIIIYPLPTIAVTGDTTLLSGGGGKVVPLSYSPKATTFNWTPPTALSCTDCANPFANPQFTTTYKVKVTDTNGCINTRDFTLIVLCNDKNFFIPNTFSPNNDGANDRFYPRGKGLDRIQALRIFNRWGELVFEKRNFPANDAASGWDGTYKGKTASSDTYVYMIDIICENATIITYKGNITLIR